MKIWLTIPMLAVALVGCSANNKQTAALEQRVNQLEADQKKLKEALKVAANFDVDAIIAQIEADKKPKDIPLDGSFAIGPENAKITIVEFSDLECPYCAMRAPIVKKIHEDHPNDVRVIYKNFPLQMHRNAKAAHAAMLAAGKQGKFWEYRYAIAEHFRNLNEAKYLEIAQKIGLNMEQFKADMVLDAEDEARFAKDMALGESIGVRGTPTYFVNGRKAEQFGPEMIEQMLKEMK